MTFVGSGVPGGEPIPADAVARARAAYRSARMAFLATQRRHDALVQANLALRGRMMTLLQRDQGSFAQLMLKVLDDLLHWGPAEWRGGQTGRLAGPLGPLDLAASEVGDPVAVGMTLRP